MSWEVAERLLSEFSMRGSLAIDLKARPYSSKACFYNILA